MTEKILAFSSGVPYTAALRNLEVVSNGEECELRNHCARLNPEQGRVEPLNKDRVLAAEGVDSVFNHLPELYGLRRRFVENDRSLFFIIGETCCCCFSGNRTCHVVI